jgi:glycosyltransferase involved in cell wall biosynthesis
MMTGQLVQTSPRVAVVHDWLVRSDGSVKVLAEILRCFPQADVFTLVDRLDDQTRKIIGGRATRTSFLQHLPGIPRLLWYYLPLMPLAVEQLDLRAYELIISSSSNVAKGVLVGPDQVHVSYVHSPMRFVWDLQQYYLERFGWDRGVRRLAASAVFHYLRQWDRASTNGVDRLIAPSEFVARRILKTYRRSASVVHPPVDVGRFTLQERKEDFYFTTAYLNPFKNVDLVVRAFAQLPGLRLVVGGDGPDRNRIRALSAPNITFVGHLTDADVSCWMCRAKAFVYAAPEDFGIVLVEAQACGTPVIALGVGGACEIFSDMHDRSPTAVLYAEATEVALIHAIERFERNSSSFSPAACRENAMRFTAPAFRARFSAEVTKALAGANSIPRQGNQHDGSA